jgi:hypothetical protein
MRKINLNKTKVLLALTAVFVASACQSKKNDPAVAAPDTVTELSCFNDPTACSVGQQYSMGYFLAATSNQSDINNRRAIDMKLAFYGSDGDAVYRSASNDNVFYIGPVSAIGTASIMMQARNEFSAPANSFGVNNDRRCRIPDGDYNISTVQEGQWSQRPARKNAVNNASIDAVDLQIEGNGNMIYGTLENAAINFRKESLQLTGTLIIHRVNKQNCQFNVQL